MISVKMIHSLTEMIHELIFCIFSYTPYYNIQRIKRSFHLTKFKIHLHLVTTKVTNFKALFG